EMLDESHVDIAGEQRELNRAKFVEGPAFPSAAGDDGFVPNCCHSFAKRLVLDLHQAGKKFRDFGHAVVRFLRCCHGGQITIKNSKFQAPTSREAPSFKPQNKWRISCLEFG